MQAQRLVAEGRVTVGGAPARKPAAQVAPADALHVSEEGPDYVSRGAHKLAGALERFDVTVEGCVCLDAGASTGGFTDVLLRSGAARVVAVDVGYGQLAWRLRQDPRVEVRERTNVRQLRPGDIGEVAPTLVVADLSFISLALVLPALRHVADPAAAFVLLVKPQFEAGREAVGPGGVVRDPAAWAAALERVVQAGHAAGLELVDACVSPLPGPAGNVEFFVFLRAGGSDALEVAPDDRHAGEEGARGAPVAGDAGAAGRSEARDAAAAQARDAAADRVVLEAAVDEGRRLAGR